MSPRGERGTAAVELALIGTLLLLVAVASLPIFSLLAANRDAGQVAAEGLRFATKAQANPCQPGADGCVFEIPGPCPTLTRRPSAADVERYVRTSFGDESVTVIVHVPGDPETLVQPCTALPGTQLAVTASYDHDLGVLAAAANGATRLVGGEPLFPDDQARVTATAVGVEE